MTRLQYLATLADTSAEDLASAEARALAAERRMGLLTGGGLSAVRGGGGHLRALPVPDLRRLLQAQRRAAGLTEATLARVEAHAKERRLGGAGVGAWSNPGLV